MVGNQQPKQSKEFYEVASAIVKFIEKNDNLKVSKGLKGSKGSNKVNEINKEPQKMTNTSQGKE